MNEKQQCATCVYFTNEDKNGIGYCELIGQSIFSEEEACKGYEEED